MPCLATGLSGHIHCGNRTDKYIQLGCNMGTGKPVVFPKWVGQVRVQCWILTHRHTPLVTCKWVFHIKKDTASKIECYKARLVAKGFTQIYGVDYYDTFAPVAKLASIQTILAIAARNDWDIDLFDFHSAFLNGELDSDEEVFMDQPPGYEDSDPHKFV
jgi:hypothetical protein